MSLKSPTCDIEFNGCAEAPKFNYLMPGMLVFLSITSSLLSLVTLYHSFFNYDLFFLNSVSYFSAGLLAVLHFQLFGIFMALGLSYNQEYFECLTIAGLNCFLSSITANKMVFSFFMIQNANDPLMNANSFRSPRVRFSLLLITSELVAYLLGFNIIKFRFFNWYLSLFYLYPIIHILSAIRRGNRNNFRW